LIYSKHNAQCNRNIAIL